MEFDTMPVTTATTTAAAAAAAAAAAPRPEQESDAKGGRPRHVWSGQEEEVLYRIWGRDNYLLTKHGKNTVFFAQWADEMRDKYDIVVRPEEVQQKVNTTRAKFRQVKKMMAQGNTAHKWKKFDLVSLILRNEYRPEGAEPLPAELLEKNRDISPSELTQMVGSQSPTAPNNDNSREEEAGPFDTSLTGLQVNNQLMTQPLFGASGSANGVSAAVDDGLSGELFGDALAALSEEDIKSNFMQYQFQQDQPKQDQQQQHQPQQDNEQNQSAENGQQTSAEREQILLAQAQQQLQEAYQLEQQQQQQQPQQLQQQQLQQQLHQQQHESQLKHHLLQKQQQTMQEQQRQQLLMQQHQQAMQQQQQNASYNHASVVVSNPATESTNNNLVNNPGSSSANILPGSANATEAPKLIHATTVDNPNVAWGLKAPPLTTSATFDRPLNNYVYKPQNPRPPGQQQARKRRQVTSEPHSNGAVPANGDSMEMMYLAEVRKRNCLLEEQRDISLKRLELERRKVSMMEQFFPRCLEMQQAILSQLRPGT